MTYQFPADIDERIKALLASGDYVGEDDVLRSAVHALEQRRQEVAAIREGLADVEAGRSQHLLAAEGQRSPLGRGGC